MRPRTRPEAGVNVRAVLSREEHAALIAAADQQGLSLQQAISEAIRLWLRRRARVVKTDTH